MNAPHAASSRPDAAAKQAGPDYTVNRMRLFAVRRLSTGETRLASSIFGGAINYARVRIVQLPPLGFGAMAPFDRFIIFSNWRAARDFAAADLLEQSWLIHELAHVWQAKRGLVLPILKLGAMGKKAYRVPADRKLRQMNIEAQAEVARLLFLARWGKADEKGPSQEDLEKLWRGA
ncbi:MAG: hypothetical protein AB7O04_14095 [Hyphomonadaceae bacterium]